MSAVSSRTLGVTGQSSYLLLGVSCLYEYLRFGRYPPEPRRLNATHVCMYVSPTLGAYVLRKVAGEGTAVSSSSTLLLLFAPPFDAMGWEVFPSIYIQQSQIWYLPSATLLKLLNTSRYKLPAV